MEEVRFYYDRKNAKLRFINGFLIMVVSFISPLMTANRDPNMRVYALCILAGALLLYFYLCRHLWLMYTTDNPGLVLNSEGIWDYRDRKVPQAIPWSHVISCQNRHDGSIRIALDSAIYRDAPRLWRIANCAILGENRIYLHADMYGVTPEEIEFKVNAFMTAAHAAQPPE